jgi:hypothetical protein
MPVVHAAPMIDDAIAHHRKRGESTGRGRADLHVHTLYSDGGQSPEAVVRAAAGRVDVVGITDHDRVGGASTPSWAWTWWWARRSAPSTGT